MSPLSVRLLFNEGLDEVGVEVEVRVDMGVGMRVEV